MLRQALDLVAPSGDSERVVRHGRRVKINESTVIPLILGGRMPTPKTVSPPILDRKNALFTLKKDRFGPAIDHPALYSANYDVWLHHGVSKAKCLLSIAATSN